MWGRRGCPGHARRGSAALALIGFLLLVLSLVAADVRPSTLPDASASARPEDTTPPVADAGPDQTVNEDAPVSFDGSGSTDNVGIVNYTWILPDPARAVGDVRSLISIAPGAVAAAFDPVRPLVYVLRPGLIEATNLVTGAVDRTYAIDHTPQWPMSLAVAPRGTYLAVGIPTGPRGYYEFGPYASWIATVDLVAQAKIGEFFIDEDVYRILATSDGHVIVSGGSGQWADLRYLDARSGAEVGPRQLVWQYNGIALHPSEGRVYDVDEDGLSPPGIERNDFTADSGFYNHAFWPYHGDYYPGRGLWASERMILTGSGLVLGTMESGSVDMEYRASLGFGISAATFDPFQALILVVQETWLHFFDMDTLVPLGSRDVGTMVTAIVIQGTDAYAFTGDGVIAVRVPRHYAYGVTTTLTYPEPGTYDVSLIVRDAAGNTATDTAMLTVLDITAPVADAGPDQTVTEGTDAVFDMYASTDNVEIVSATWTFTDVVPLTFEGATLWYSFDNAGTFVITLTVVDGAGNLGTDTVIATVVPDTVPPIANAGPDQVVMAGMPVQLADWGSADDVGIASFVWTFVDGGPQTLYGDVVLYAFVTVGVYIVTLTVTDLSGNFATDDVTITVTRDPVPPVAVAGPGLSVFEGATVMFDGSASYDNMGIASYTWTFDDGGSRTLSGPTPSYRFETAGTFGVTLTVTDLDGNEATATLVVTVRPIVLVKQEHAARGFRIEIPEGWGVQKDVPIGGDSEPVDLVAIGPPTYGRETSLIVVSEAVSVQETDAFLREAADALLQEIRNEFGYIEMVRSIEIISTRNARGAVFEYYYPASQMNQAWLLVASASRSRLYATVFTIESSSAGEYRPLYSAIFASFEVIDPGLLGNAAILVGGGILGAVAVVVVALVVWARRRAAVRRVPRAPPSSPLVPTSPLQAARPLPPAPGTVGAAAAGHPHFCGRCGQPLVPPYRFCRVCGTKAGP